VFGALTGGGGNSAAQSGKSGGGIGAVLGSFANSIASGFGGRSSGNVTSGLSALFQPSSGGSSASLGGGFNPAELVGNLSKTTSGLKPGSFSPPKSGGSGAAFMSTWVGMALQALPLIVGLFGKKKPDREQEKQIARIGINTYGYRKGSDGNYFQDKLIRPDFNKINAKYRSEKLPNYATGNMAELGKLMGGVPNCATGNMSEVVANYAMGNMGGFSSGSLGAANSIVPRKPKVQPFNSIVPNHAAGNLQSLAGGVNRGYMKGVPSPDAIEAALKREGAGGVVSVLKPNELVLSPQQTAKFFRMGMDRDLSVANYAMGNMGGFNAGSLGAGYTPNFAGGGMIGGTTNQNISVPVNVNVEGRGGNGGDGTSGADVSGFRNILDAKIRQIVTEESRPGGTIYNRFGR
jgi:hypothetical protein